MAEDQGNVLPPLEKPPLVTFALFAYNQEKYIREAVEGAFAQTYEPLEIILSDDCSTDRTFEIIEEMAANYSGPHKITTRRSTKNVSLWHHFADVVDMAKGSILIAGAGDDVSEPFRTERLINTFHKHENIDVVYTSYSLIDDSGRTTRENENPNSEYFFLKRIVAEACNEQLHSISGCSAAYKVDFLRETIASVTCVRQPHSRLFIEDALLAYYASIKKRKVLFLPNMPLVKYRIHGNSLSQSEPPNTTTKTIASIRKEVGRELFLARSHSFLMSGIREISLKEPAADDFIDWEKFYSIEKEYLLKKMTEDNTFIERIKMSKIVSNWLHFKLWITRVFGASLLVQIKYARSLVTTINKQETSL